MVNVEPADVPPPGPGLLTVTEVVPGFAMSAALIVALILVALENVVVRDEPFQFTTEVETKFVPVTVSVNAAPPWLVPAGDSLVTVGTGLLMVNVFDADVPPPGLGLLTVMDAVPALLRTLDGTVAVSEVLLTNVVVRFAPFHWTFDPFT
jgi:hypothetical protein